MDAAAAAESASLWATGYSKQKCAGTHGVIDSDCVIHLTARRVRQTLCTAGLNLYLWFIPMLMFVLFADDCIRLTTLSNTVLQINLTGTTNFIWQDIMDQVFERYCYQPSNIGEGKPLWANWRPSESPSDGIRPFIVMLKSHRLQSSYVLSQNSHH